MKEIKFRAWDKLHKRLADVLRISFLSGKVLLEDLEDVWEININNIVIEQYTGLEDKYGAEIYEGDIIHGYDQEPDRYDGYIGSSVIEVVNFADGAFWLGNVENQIGVCVPPIIEIVGNIHENADLWGAENENSMHKGDD